MNNKLIILLLAVILCLNVIGGGVLYFQKKELSDLRSKYSNISLLQDSSAAKAVTGEELVKIKDKLAELQFKSLVDSEKQIQGTIVNISNDSMTVKTQIKELDKLKDVDLTQGYIVESKDVEYVVAFDANTNFDSREKAALKQGDLIRAESDQTIYGKDTFVAKAITYLYPLEFSEKPTPEQMAKALENSVNNQ
ncbi:MAG: hypothetical protein US63_C0031G0006 [Candidatus Moranbacteria bacterium GW2011_GWC2_37_8]|nr:MAG: hypothetical protein US63_C0031G0006 [Candidatus Moranbacteria bacterium GW2011_GWC2_37_8]KKQ61612.1 MAG: hypothetical protein US82_C0020G0007 [Parcubacteria group bacterium GW2011_GWC1_38_22]KKQ80888.1 MAG: hypothetical protein UT03_C0017G0003 [Candidatus Moranbacteria bacterium GW2011_GWD2_38_7]